MTSIFSPEVCWFDVEWAFLEGISVPPIHFASVLRRRYICSCTLASFNGHSYQIWTLLGLRINCQFTLLISKLLAREWSWLKKSHVAQQHTYGNIVPAREVGLIVNRALLISIINELTNHHKLTRLILAFKITIFLVSRCQVVYFRSKQYMSNNNNVPSFETFLLKLSYRLYLYFLMEMSEDGNKIKYLHCN